MEDPIQDTSMNYQNLLLSTISRMVQAHAHGKIGTYWIYFKSAIRLTTPYIPPAMRNKVEEDYEQFMQNVDKIKNDKEKNEKTKEAEILQLQGEFADNNEFYIMKALSRSGIVKIRDEGIIDFEKYEIEQYQKVIRNSAGLPSSLDQAGILTKEEPKTLKEAEVVKL